MKTEALTPRQQVVLKFIVGFIAEHGYPPTMKEIGDGLGMSSSSTVHYFVHVLADKGRIVIHPGMSPRLEVVA